MVKTFDCPNCGAPLGYKGGSEATFRCPYCQKNIIVPQELRLKEKGKGTTGTTITKGTSSRIACALVAIAIVIVLIGAISVIILLSNSNKAELRNEPQELLQIPTLVFEMPILPSSTPGFASLVLKFGGEGIGPGLLNDSRSIAVDGDGNIYLGDYEGGRIQVFNQDGKFITQWNYNADAYLMGLTADRHGIVYVIINEGIQKYEGSSGKFLGKVNYPDWGFDDAFSTPDGGILASIYTGNDDIVRFDSNGKIIRTIRSAISSQTGDSELAMKVAEDGLGNIYALGVFNSAVFKFSPQGKFLNKIGSEGNELGQFRAVEDITIDGQGRIYVSDIHGIQVFDTEGRFLSQIEIEGAAFGLVFTAQNELLVTNRTYVFKYTINTP